MNKAKFVAVPEELIKDTHLTVGEKCLYIALGIGDENPSDFDIDVLGFWLGRGKGSLYRYMKHLIERGWVERKNGNYIVLSQKKGGKA